MANPLLKFMKIRELIINHKLLIIVLLLASFLRLWDLGNIPPGLTPDEATLGYNAFSIMKTGRDEHGQIFPIIFKSFGDYKPGLYVYAAMPFVALFGLNEVTVRLPSALAGIITVLLIYLIVREFLSNKWPMVNGLWSKNIKSSQLTINNKSLSILSAFIAATSPWLIYLSRGAWEANLSLILTLAGIYFFLRSIGNRKLLYLSSLSFSLTLITYQGAKLSTSIVVLCLLISFWKEVKNLWHTSRSVLLKSIAIGIIFSLPIVFSFFYGQTGRLNVFSIFNYPRPKEYLLRMLNEGTERVGDINYYLFHSELLNFIRGIFGRFYNHFSGKFLFFDGDYQNPMHSAPNHGMLLLIDLMLLPIGFVFLLKSKIENPKSKIFVLLWLLLSPLPAILSRDQVQSVRALNMSIPLVIISTFGFYYLYIILKTSKYSRILLTTYYLLLTSSYAYFLDSYFVHLPKHNAKYWMYGYKQVVEKVIPVQKYYDRVIFQQSYNQPYIYFLFFQKYDSVEYQKESHFTEGGLDVGLVRNLDNIEFSNFSWPPAIEANKKTLIIGDPVAIPPDFSKSDYNLISEIKYPDGISTAFRIIETRNNY